jgi:hypothetical protein
MAYVLGPVVTQWRSSRLSGSPPEVRGVVAAVHCAYTVGGGLVLAMAAALRLSKDGKCECPCTGIARRLIYGIRLRARLAHGGETYRRVRLMRLGLNVTADSRDLAAEPSHCRVRCTLPASPPTAQTHSRGGHHAAVWPQWPQVTA